MTTFIKAKCKKLDDQTNIGNYSFKYDRILHILSKLFFLKLLLIAATATASAANKNIYQIIKSNHSC